MISTALKYREYFTNQNVRHRKYKTVKLVNADECQQVTFIELLNKWQSTGYFEWEDQLIRMFMDAVEKAKESDSKEADLTELFSCEVAVWGRHGKVWLKQKKIHEHILPSFLIVKEDEKELKLKLIT